jgi:3-methyladenine DNA glycosylase AlkD
MTPQALLDALRDAGMPQKAAEAAAYHKTPRPFLGVPGDVLEQMARDARAALSLEQRLDGARALWDTDIHDARVLAAKLLTQARIKPDDGAVWGLIVDWAQSFDSWALADHAAIAGAKRVQADLRRLDTLESWLEAPNMWTRRAALVMTLPLARLPFAKGPERDARTRILGWAAHMAPDRDRFIQKAIAWWLRDLSARDPDIVQAFLAGPGAALSAPAQREALRRISP